MADQQEATLRSVLHGRRGRLLIALLITEFAAGVQGLAYTTVLPLAAHELRGEGLYGATLTAGTLATIAMLSIGTAITARFSAKSLLLVATVLFLVGVIVSATAPTMWLVLGGTIIRGLAGGLIAGFGLSAIGGLFDGAERTKVLGLFAAIWIVPSLVGPLLNAGIATLFGWRWSLVWPGVLLVLARLLIVRDIEIIPWSRGKRQVRPLAGIAVVAGLVIVATAPAIGNWAPVSLAIGTVITAVAGYRILHRAAGNAVTTRILASFGLLSLTFFGADALIPPSVITGLGRSVISSAIIVSCGLLAWSLVGLKPPQPSRVLPAPMPVGMTVLTLAVLGVGAAHLLPNWPAVIVTAVLWTIGGIGMGATYSPMMSAAFDAPSTQSMVEGGGDVANEERNGADATTSVATGVAFAELTGGALGPMVVGTAWPITVHAGWGGWAFAALFGLLGAAGVVGLILLRRNDESQIS